MELKKKMKINIPFNDWSKEKLRSQNKKATSRNSKYGKVGDTFKVILFENGLFIEYELELILRLPLWFVQKIYTGLKAQVLKKNLFQFGNQYIRERDTYLLIWFGIITSRRYKGLLQVKK